MLNVIMQSVSFKRIMLCSNTECCYDEYHWADCCSATVSELVNE
jgi:hypothetical protein